MSPSPRPPISHVAWRFVGPRQNFGIQTSTITAPLDYCSIFAEDIKLCESQPVHWLGFPAPSHHEIIEIDTKSQPTHIPCRMEVRWATSEFRDSDQHSPGTHLIVVSRGWMCESQNVSRLSLTKRFEPSPHGNGSAAVPRSLQNGTCSRDFLKEIARDPPATPLQSPAQACIRLLEVPSMCI